LEEKGDHCSIESSPSPQKTKKRKRRGGLNIESKQIEISDSSSKTDSSSNSSRESSTETLGPDNSTSIIIPEEALDCAICGSLFYQPIVTPCGHAFCKPCILTLMIQMKDRCPTCQTTIHITPDYGICTAIYGVIQQCFPQEYEQRKLEIEQEENLISQAFSLPLLLIGDFVFFPYMNLPMHIFEPRYVELVKRCLAGGRRFGILSMNEKELGQIATIAVIESHFIFPDGRHLISTVGESRVKVLEMWMEEGGYNGAKVEYLSDKPSPASVNKEIHNTITRISELIEKKIEEKKIDKEEIEEKQGKMPTVPEKLSWWLASSLSFSPKDKFKLLSTQSLFERLTLLEVFIANL